MSKHIWEANLTALRRKQPGLANALASASPTTQRYISGQASDGSPLLGVRLDDGRAVSLSSPQQPSVEAAQWVSSLGNTFSKGACAVLVGFGDGYCAEALANSSDPNSLLWVIEPDIELFAAIVRLRDFTALISSPQVLFYVGAEAKECAQSLLSGKYADRVKAQGAKMCAAPFANHLYPEFIQSFQKEFLLALQLETVKFKTWEEHADVMFTNIVRNLPAVLKGAPALRLFNQAVGETAFVIAPGPSLEDALPAIQEVQDSVILIAVDTAHRILVTHGIHSDLVVSIDFTELNEKHFVGLDDPNSCLVGFPAISPTISKQYEGRAFYYDHISVNDSAGANPLIQELQSLGPLGNLLSQGSTAHAAYHLARMMGCAPIVLIGNDLGFPGKRFYADGAMQNELDQTERQTERMLDVESNDAKTIQTNGLYKIYLEGFKDLINETRGVVFNASIQGAKIVGAPYRPLEQVCEHLYSTRLDKSFIQRSLAPSLRHQTNGLVEELSSLSSDCKDARKQIRRNEKKLEQLNPNQIHFTKQVVEFMKEFQQTFRRYKTALTLCLTLCPRSYFSVVNKKDDAGFGADASLEEKQRAHQRYLDLFHDLSKTLRRASTEFDEIINQLRS